MVLYNRIYGGVAIMKYNNFKKLKELRQLRDQNALAQEVARMAKQLNQRFYRIEKAEKGIRDTAYYFAQEETGREHPRYSVNADKLASMDATALYELGLNINEKLKSETSTLRGLTRVYNRRLDNSSKALSNALGENVSPEDVKTFVDAGGDELLNDSKYYDSNQIIDDWLEWRNKGVSLEEFIKTYKEEKIRAQKARKYKEVDLERITRKFRKLSRKKKR